jgi:hypothetical protein
MGRDSVADIQNLGTALAKGSQPQKWGAVREQAKHMVYVLNRSGAPLMPTKRHGKAGHLLEDGKAKAAKLEPSAIQLLYESPEYTQPVILGVDAGSKTIGISATTKKEELYAAEVKLRTDIVDLLSTRRAFRS